LVGRQQLLLGLDTGKRKYVAIVQPEVKTISGSAPGSAGCGWWLVLICYERMYCWLAGG